MHSGLGHHGGHGYNCQGHAHLGGLRTSDQDSFRGNMGYRGSGGNGIGVGRRFGTHSHLGRDGSGYGWGREGRVRLDDSSMHYRRRGSMGDGFLGGMGGGLGGGLGGMGGLDGGAGLRGGMALNLGGPLGGGLGGGGLGGGGLGGGGGYLRGMGGIGGIEGMGGMRGVPRGVMRADLFEGLGNRGSPLIGRGVPEAALLGGGGGMGLGGMGVRDRLGSGGGRSLFNEANGLVGGGFRSPSGSDYSLDHLDRRSRPYHYQHPYVEDYESELGEQDMLEMMEMMRNGGDMYGFGGLELEDLIGAMGGLGVRGARM